MTATLPSCFLHARGMRDLQPLRDLLSWKWRSTELLASVSYTLWHK